MLRNREDRRRKICTRFNNELIDCAIDACAGQDGFYQTGCPSEGRFIDNGDGTVTDTRLRREKTELEDRLRLQKEIAVRLIQLIQADGNGTGALAEELRRTGDEMDDVKGRLDEVASDLSNLEAHVLTERDVIDALERLDPVWEQPFPAEQTRIVQLLVERVEVQPDAIELRLRSEGLRSLGAEISGGSTSAQEGARAG